MKIAHISDIHIRNLKYHDDYTRFFEDLYDRLEKIKPDLIVNTGDTAHTKTQISPEFVEMASRHFRRASQIAPYHIILGNHDLNLMNPDRQDAISPIVDSLKDSCSIFLHKKSGIVESGIDGFKFWVFSCADEENFPRVTDDGSVRIGLFHGSISGCVTDSDWVMNSAEREIDLFENLDYVLMGDIHKQQFMTNDKRIAYAGSLIQQNYGEDLEKGFLLWDIRSRNDFNVEFIPLKGGRKFYTISLGDDLSIPDDVIPPNQRIRVLTPPGISVSQQKQIEKYVRKSFKPHDLLIVSKGTFSKKQLSSSKLIENIRDSEIQKSLLVDFLKSRKVDEQAIQAVLEINQVIDKEIRTEDDVARNTTWLVKKIGWNNMFNYGEGNIIDFESFKGITGVFGPNTSGKSSLIEIFTEALFDKISKDIDKNIELINDNKEKASMVVEVESGEDRFSIERTIERIKYGQRKLSEAKEWGKTFVDFSRFLGDGSKESLNGTLRPETEREIRRHIGTFEDFSLTSLSAQGKFVDMINCRETERRKIMFKFLDLDVFEEKCKAAKEQLKVLQKHLSEIGDEGELLLEMDKRKSLLSRVSREIERVSGLQKVTQAQIAELELSDRSLLFSKKKVDPTCLAIDLSECQRAIGKCDEFLEKSNVAQFNHEQEIAKLDEQISSWDHIEDVSDKLDDLKAREREIVGLLMTVEQKQAAKTAEVNQVGNQEKLLSVVPCGDSFPTCQFLLTAFEARKNKPRLQDEKSQLAASKIRLHSEKVVLQKMIQSLESRFRLKLDRTNVINQKTNESLRLENLKHKIKLISEKKKELLRSVGLREIAESDIITNKEIDGKIEKVRSQKVKLTSLLGEYQRELDSLNREYGATESVVSRLEKVLEKISGAQKQCQAFEYFVDAMGKHGIPYQILTKQLPIINEEINKILSNVVGFKVFIEHDDDEQSIKLYLQYGDYRSRNLGLASGAEKFISSLAIRAALLSVSNLPKTNIFIIDEGFGSLDPSHLESIHKMFDYLRVSFEHVLLISHVESLKDVVDNTIEISTDGEGYAHVEIC